MIYKRTGTVSATWTHHLQDENMRIIISPAKKMRADTDFYAAEDLPVYLDKTEILMKWIQGLSYQEQKKLWACNDAIAKENNERFAEMNLRENITPAILAYDGIQYTYMAPSVFESTQFDYIQKQCKCNKYYCNSELQINKILELLYLF